MENTIKNNDFLKFIQETTVNAVKKIIAEEKQIINEELNLINDPVIKKYFDLIKNVQSDEELVKIINDIFMVAYNEGSRFSLEMKKKHLK